MEIVFGPALGLSEMPSEEAKVEIIKAGQTSLTKLKTWLKKSGDFAAGSHITLADIQLFFEVHLWFICHPKVDTDAHAEVGAWMERCKEVPELHKVWQEMKDLGEPFVESLGIW